MTALLTGDLEKIRSLQQSAARRHLAELERAAGRLVLMTCTVPAARPRYPTAVVREIDELTNLLDVQNAAEWLKAGRCRGNVGRPTGHVVAALELLKQRAEGRAAVTRQERRNAKAQQELPRQEDDGADAKQWEHDAELRAVANAAAEKAVNEYIKRRRRRSSGSESEWGDTWPGSSQT